MILLFYRLNLNRTSNKYPSNNFNQQFLSHEHGEENIDNHISLISVAPEGFYKKSREMITPLKITPG